MYFTNYFLQVILLLGVVQTYPKDHLHAIKLYAKSGNWLYIKEAPIDFEFVPDPSSKKLMLVTYNAHGKDAEWKQ